jgi:hypothetical protein
MLFAEPETISHLEMHWVLHSGQTFQNVLANVMLFVQALYYQRNACTNIS